MRSYERNTCETPEASRSQGETANDIFIKHEGVLVLARLSNLNYDNNPKT